MAAKTEADIAEVGVFSPHPTPLSELGPGDVGYIITGVKDVGELQVGDTITHARNPTEQPLPGFEAARQMVFSGSFRLIARNLKTSAKH